MSTHDARGAGRRSSRAALLRRAVALLPPALLPLAAACSTYRAATPDLVPEGARVRLVLTPEGSSALAPTLGASVTGVEGEWGGGGGDSVVVRVQRLLTVPGVTIAWNGAAVGVRRGAIRSVERVTLSRPRTALLVGGGAALAAVLVELFRRGGKERGGVDGGTSPF